MFKQELIDAMNAELTKVWRENKSLFEDGSEDEILLKIETSRQVYNMLKENGAKIARQRRLKKLKEYGDATVKPEPRLVDGKKQKKGKPSKTKDERLSDSLKNLGLDPKDFFNTLGGKKK